MNIVKHEVKNRRVKKEIIRKIYRSFTLYASIRETEIKTLMKRDDSKSKTYRLYQIY